MFEDYLTAATQCQTQISNIAQKGSLAARYCVVLEELRLEAVKQIDRSNHAPPTERNGNHGRPTNESLDQTTLPADSAADQNDSGLFSTLPTGGEDFDFNPSPESSLADITSWVQFESMVGLNLVPRLKFTDL
jgi:hypothetical protein